MAVTSTCKKTTQQHQFTYLSVNTKTALAEIEQENISDSLSEQQSWEKQTPMMTLSLLHPKTSLPAQTWHIEANSSLTIGRSRNNQVTVYSTVVSRYHLEIRPREEGWELLSFGSNGTFYQGERLKRIPLKNGMVIQLGSSGPKLQIWIDWLVQQTKQLTVQLPQRERKELAKTTQPE